MTAYTITQGDTWEGDERRWTHFVHDEHGARISQYHDERDISKASTDSHDVVSTACSELGLPFPDWVDHDGGYIHFGYGTPADAVRKDD